MAVAPAATGIHNADRRVTGETSGVGFWGCLRMIVRLFGCRSRTQRPAVRTIRAMNMASASASWGQICKVPSVASSRRGCGKGSS